MQPNSDPLISQEQGGAGVGGYQSIEGGQSTGPTPPDVVPTTFLSQVRGAKEQSQGCCDFCLTFFGILLGSIVWFLVLVITLTLPLVMIVLGATYFHDCKAQHMIPVFNIVAGCVILVNNVMNLVTRCQRFSEVQMPRTPTAVGWITTVLNVFLLAWFIAGCYWVYGAYSHDNLKCNLTLYAFSFWLLNACFIFFIAMVVASIIMMCLALICW